MTERGIIGPVWSWGDLAARGIGYKNHVKEADEDALFLAKLAPSRARARLAEGGIVTMDQPFLGEYLVLPRPDGRRDQLEAVPLYAACWPELIPEAAEMLASACVERWGPGQLWMVPSSFSVILPYEPDNARTLVDIVDGEPYVRLRAYVGHDPGTLVLPASYPT